MDYIQEEQAEPGILVRQAIQEPMLLVVALVLAAVAAGLAAELVVEAV